MNETKKFRDEHGDSFYAFGKEGKIELHNFGAPWLTPKQIRELAKELLIVADEVESKS